MKSVCSSDDSWPFSPDAVDVIGSPKLSRLFAALKLECPNEISPLSLPEPQYTENLQVIEYLSSSDLMELCTPRNVDHKRADQAELVHSRSYETLKCFSSPQRQPREVSPRKFPQWDIWFPSGVEIYSSPLNEVYVFPPPVGNANRSRRSSGTKMAGYHFIENERSEKLTKLEPLLPKNDPRILETMETLAAVCHNQAKYAQAEGWYRKIIAIREITDHALSPKTLWAQIFLCETLNCQSKDFEANEILQSINTAIMTQFEPSHSIVLAFLTITILVAFGLGDARGQEVHCRELVQITLEAFGPRHSATLDAIAMLTTPLFNEGSVEESENLLWAMMQLSNEVKEIEAEVTIGRMCYSADLLYQRRQYASSVELCRAQLERAKITLGDGHLVTMRCSSRLGVGLRQLGNLNESEEILRDTIKMESEVLGSEYWQTRDSMYELG
jgi:hypothetical protein